MLKSILLAAAALQFSTGLAAPTVVDAQRTVTYQGLDRNGIEVFLNIPYGQDTSGAHRFKPPRPHVPANGSTIVAQSYGPACPQPLGEVSHPLAWTAVTDVSEDCLNLNVARPRNVSAGARLPVMVYIYGGGFWTGQNREQVIAPDGLVLNSVENGLPVIHVAMNYRLGFFGFARSAALESEGSENAGLRDQRLAIEWVRDNIAHFGGDPQKITIFGQSSGGLAVGMQVMAYGATKPVPFQQAICESQALELGITGNFTTDAMQALVSYVGCNTSSLDAAATVSCLRAFDTATLLNASIATYQSDIAHNVGDIWLPAVDGDFLPAAPSELIAKGRFANVSAVIGWCEDDVALFTDTTIATANDTSAFLASYLPDLTPENLDALLNLYPVAEFAASTNLSAEFHRTARIFRDIIMTCMPLGYGAAIAGANPANDVFLYAWNQSILGPALVYAGNPPGLGVVHTSEFAYVFGNLSHYNSSGYPFTPTPADWALQDRGSRSWSTFASTGRPSERNGSDTFQGWGDAFAEGHQTRIFVVGGPEEGLSATDGRGAKSVVEEQRLRERCAFLNSEEIVKQLAY